MKLKITSAALVLCLTGAQAQTATDCQTMAKATGNLVGPTSTMLAAVESVGQHAPKMQQTFGARLGQVLSRHEDARQQLASALRNYLVAAREMRNGFEACS
jgi:hypothetical protein